MAKYIFELKLSSLTDSEGFKEATREELAVLLFVISRQGVVESTEELAHELGLSKSRISSALSLWRECGVLVKQRSEKAKTAENEPHTPTITTEFEPNPFLDFIDEESSEKVAENIRDGNLKEVMDECARLMGIIHLNGPDVKRIAALWSQYDLSGEYLLMLASHIAEKGKLTVPKLFSEAKKCYEKGITTAEELGLYLRAKETASSTEYEIRRLLGIWNRSLSEGEKLLFKKWTEDFGYSVTVIGEAYSIATLKNVQEPLKYMDVILTDWHDSGCRTLEDCRARCEKHADALPKEPEKTTARGRKKDTAKTPKYTEFDSEDALMKALARSYGTDSANNNEDSDEG